MSDRLGIQVPVDSSTFVILRLRFWSVQGICTALLTYQLIRVLQGLSKRPSLHSLITLLKRCVSQMQFRLCMLSSGPMKAAHALDSTKNMSRQLVPISAAGLPGEQPLVDRIMLSWPRGMSRLGESHREPDGQSKSNLTVATARRG